MTTLAQARASLDAARTPQAADATLWQEHGFALPGRFVLAVVATIAALSLLLG